MIVITIPNKQLDKKKLICNLDFDLQIQYQYPKCHIFYFPQRKKN